MVARKVFMLPTPSEARNDDSNSINQIVLRLQSELKEYGWEIVEDENEADVIAVHAGQTTRDIRCDVAHCHGLYPTGVYPNVQWHWRANHNVIEKLKQAKIVTVPSSWVADILRRDMNIEPEVVRWAITRSEWIPTEHKAYTLWNKTRVSSVCDPTPIVELATRIPDAPFVTTFMPDGGESHLGNLRVTGRMPFAQMQPIVREAAVYLATTKETFGIGILEAMSSGAPILGYRWGAVPDIVTHGVDGYLVEPGDIDGLVDGWRWVMRHRKTLAWNARQTAIDDYYTWERVARHFAGIYDDIYDAKNTTPETKVTVVIPNHNYDNYVERAIQSAIWQQTDFEFEVVVVNDTCDNDQTPTMVRAANKAKGQCAFRWDNVQFRSVAKARNHAIRTSKSPYILCLDADDELANPFVLQTFYDALEADPELGIAYGRLAVFQGDAQDGATVSTFPDEYRAEHQINGSNQVPSCCMFRRRAWEVAGGYRQHLEPAEDAGLWTSMALRGYGGKLVTDDVTILYRMHDKSLSHKVRTREIPDPQYARLSPAHLTGVYPLASAANAQRGSHPVYNYDKPVVSVIIPVGAGHEDYVIRAVDSVMGQTYWDWECIVVNDTGKPMVLPQKGVLVVGTRGGRTGAGNARNLGIDFARGEYLVFLDADDTLEPRFIENTLPLAIAHNRYVYTNWYDAKRGVQMAKTYSQDRVFRERSFHAVTVMVKKSWVVEVGKFDTDMPAWEDTDLFMRLAISGYCGEWLPEALFQYNYDTGQRRKQAEGIKPELRQTINSRYSEYREGRLMPKECCGKGAKVVDQSLPDEEIVEVIMLEGSTGGKPVIGSVTGTRYGLRARNEQFQMYAPDVKADPKRFQVVESTVQTKPTQEPLPPARVDPYPL